MRYYLNDAGGWLSASGDLDAFGGVPAGYREVTETEFNEASGAIIVTVPQEAPASEPGDRPAA